MRDSTTNRKKQTLYTVTSIMILTVLWWWAAVWVGKSYILPTPVQALRALFEVCTSESFFKIISMSMLRVLICVISSLIVGSVLGVSAGLFEMVEYLLKPTLLITRTLPTIVIIVYVILWMPSALAPIFVTFLVTFPIVYANVLEGFKQTDWRLVEMARLYKVRTSKVVYSIYWPSILPYLRSSVVATTSLGLKIIIASEVLSQTDDSIGKSFQMAKVNIQTERVFAWAIITIILALLLDWLMKRLMGRRISHGKTL